MRSAKLFSNAGKGNENKKKLTEPGAQVIQEEVIF